MVPPLMLVKAKVVALLGILTAATFAGAAGAAEPPAPASSKPDSEPAIVIDPSFYRHRPTPMSFEAGIYFGLAWFSSDLNLQDLSKVGPRNPHQELNNAPSVGLRAGFFPLAFLGGEVEGGVIPSHTPDTQDATIWTLRGAVVGQLPLAHVVPFAYLGEGLMALVSTPLGHDTDPVTYFGAGVKLAVSQYVSFRVDARDNLMQKNRLLPGVQNGDLVHNGEILGSALFTLGRTPWPEKTGPLAPDFDRDGVPDDVDRCPGEPGVPPLGCPPPTDIDHDDVPDNSDICPSTPEDGRTPDPHDGCPSPPPAPAPKPSELPPPPVEPPPTVPPP